MMTDGQSPSEASAPSEGHESATGPCAGVRVLDLTSVVSGPVCTQHLGDFGADVIKVEPPTGDFSRLAGGAPHAGLNGFFAQYNRNKRSVVLDLKKPDAISVVRDLAAGCDVLVENYRPGVADRMGFGWETLHQVNPRLIFVSVNGFGSTGPYASHPAYDHLIQGLTGFMPVQGDAGEAKMIQTVVADKVGGLTALSAVLGALYARERTGRGQRVEVPMLDAYAAFILTDEMGPRTFVDSEVAIPSGTTIFRSFKTKDGRVVGIASQDGQYGALCQALEREDWIDDPRFSTIGARFAHLDVFYEMMAEALREWETDAFIERARQFGAPFAPVLDVEGFMQDEQVRHNETVRTQEVPGAGKARFLRPALRFEDTPASIHRPPPRLGEHTDEILEELGYDAEKRARLRNDAAVA